MTLATEMCKIIIWRKVPTGCNVSNSNNKLETMKRRLGKCKQIGNVMILRNYYDDNF